jgi:hypothetical protein
VTHLWRLRLLFGLFQELLFRHLGRDLSYGGQRGMEREIQVRQFEVMVVMVTPNGS